MKKPVPSVEAEIDLVVEDPSSGFVGAVVRCEKDVVHLEDRFGKVRGYPLGPGFWVDGRPVVLVRPKQAGPVRPDAQRLGLDLRGRRPGAGRPRRAASTSRASTTPSWSRRSGATTCAIEGVVVEPLHGVDDLPAIVKEFRPTQGRRLGVLVDHLVRGSKESRIAEQITGEHALVVGHPFIDIWQAVKPSVVGIKAWPVDPEGRALEGRRLHGAWAGRTTPATSGRSASSPACSSFTDLEPELLGRVEELIDFVTTD